MPLNPTTTLVFDAEHRAEPTAMPEVVFTPMSAVGPVTAGAVSSTRKGSDSAVAVQPAVLVPVTRQTYEAQYVKAVFRGTGPAEKVSTVATGGPPPEATIATEYTPPEVMPVKASKVPVARDVDVQKGAWTPTVAPS
jgi:hypothetical protein